MELCGPLDADVIVDSNGPKLLELNPRFGGGYPCSHLCGASFPAKLIWMFRRERLTPDIGSYPAGVCMLKQDEIVSPGNLERIRPIHDLLEEDSQEEP
jgi:carbamoyl-phosphate synthase large subunit